MNTKTIFIGLVIMLLLIPAIGARQVEDRRSEEVIVYYSICEYLKSEFNMTLDNSGHTTGQGHNIDLNINQEQYDELNIIFGDILDYPENNTIFHEMHGVWNFQCIVNKLNPGHFKMSRQGSVPPLAEHIACVGSDLNINNRHLTIDTFPKSRLQYDYSITNEGVNETYEYLEEYIDHIINFTIRNEIPSVSEISYMSIHSNGTHLFNTSMDSIITPIMDHHDYIGKKTTYPAINNVSVITYNYIDDSDTVIEITKYGLMVNDTIDVHVTCPIEDGVKVGPLAIDTIVKGDYDNARTLMEQTGTVIMTPIIYGVMILY